MVGIYKIESPSGNVYVGQSWDIKRRWARHKDLSDQKSVALQRSFKKHGIVNHIFSIVHQLPSDVSQEILDMYEVVYMGLFKECGVPLLNIREGGSRGKHSSETIEKMRIISTGNKNMLGKTHTDATKKKISMSKKGRSVPPNKGKKASDEVRKKLSDAKIGKAPWNKGVSGYKCNVSREAKEKRVKIIRDYWAIAKMEGRTVHKCGEECKGSKLTVKKVVEIIELIFQDKFSFREIGRRYGVRGGVIAGIKKNKIWKTVSPEIRGALSALSIGKHRTYIGGNKDAK